MAGEEGRGEKSEPSSLVLDDVIAGESGPIIVSCCCCTVMLAVLTVSI